MPSLVVGNRSYAEQYIGASGTLTKSHTVAAGTNRILRVKTALQEVSGTPVISGLTYAGVSLTAVPNSEQNTGVTWERVQWWYLIAPATGANNLVLTMTSGGAVNMQVVILDDSNHDGNAPVGNFKTYISSGTSLALGAIAYTDGDSIAASTVEGLNGSTTTWTNATEYDDADWQSQHSSTAIAVMSGSGNVSITATLSASDRAAISAIRIRPLAAAAEILTVGTLNPGATVAVTYQNYGSVPTTAGSSINGVGITVSGATGSGCNIVVPAESAFLFGGGLAALDFNTNATLTLGNGTDSDTHTVQIVPVSTDQIASRSAAALVNPIDSYNGGLVVATGDRVYQYSDVAESFTPDPAVNGITALATVFNLYTKFFDNSAGSWSGLTTKAFPTSTPPGGGTLSITSTLIAQNPPGTTIPANRNLTAFGGLDWLGAARLSAEGYDTKSGGTMIAAPANIGSPAWVRAEGGVEGHPLITWTDGAELGTNNGHRFYQYTTVNGAGQRFTLSPAGALVKIYLLAGGYNGPTFDVDVSFSDSSATAVEERKTVAANVHDYYLYEITAQPSGGAATIQVDFSKISGGGLIGWQALMVESGTSGAVYSLTSSDTTVTPGQSITATLAGGPFQGAITAAYAIYGDQEMPLEWEVLTPSTTTLTFPSYADLAEDGDLEYLPPYANFTIRIEAGEESADTANTNQLVFPNAGDYGIAAAPPWGATYRNLQQGDKVYGRYIFGSGTLTPETLDVAEAGAAIVEWNAFNMATQRWLRRRQIAYGLASQNRLSVFIGLSLS